MDPTLTTGVIAIVTGVIAVLGTVLGAVVSGRFQERAAGRTEAAVRAEERHLRQFDAVLDLTEAISDHRTAMWARGEALLKGDDDQRRRDLQTASHATRPAITRPLNALRMLIDDPALHASVNAMVTATFAMRAAYDTSEELTAAREAALAAHDGFVSTAGTYFRRHDDPTAPVNHR